MAAAYSNRSPSPLCSRPANPNPRNSENNSGIRRSFSGNNNPLSKPSALTNPRRFDPVTPANSPSDFARKSFVREEKENDEKEHVLKASKLQSPGKGCKNFMSPTISAASKFTPSPRKKVLVERNDPVRTSISLSDGKAMFFSNMSPNVSQEFDSKSEQNQKTESVLDPKVANSEKMKVDPVSKPSKRVSFSDVPSDSLHVSESQSESVITHSDCLKPELASPDSDSLKFESSLNNEAISSSTSIAPSIAPLDADPSTLPPYDPKTNYLSPRPQFLHYKPNPRIGILLNKDKGLDPELLEDNLIQQILSENISESSEGTEESQTEDTQNEEMEAEIEVTTAAAPADMVIGMDEMEADSHVSEPSEPLPVSTPVTNEVSEQDFVQKSGKKSRALLRLMCFWTLLMFFVVCVLSISVTHSPPLDEFVIDDLSLSDLSNFYHQSRTAVAAAAKAKFDWLARRVTQLSVSSVSFVTKLANELVNVETQVPLQFVNLSDLQPKAWDEGHFLENKASLLQLVEEDEVEEDFNADGIDIFEEEEAYKEVDSDDTEMSTESVEVTEELDQEISQSVEVAELEQEIQTAVESSTNTQDQETNLEAAIEVANISAESERTHGEFLAPGSSGDQSAAIPQDQEANLEASIDVSDVNAESERTRVEILTAGSAEDQSDAIPQDQEANLEAAAIELADFNAGSEESHVVITTLGSSASLDNQKSQSEANTQSEGVQSSSEDSSFAHKAMGVSSLFAGFLAVASVVYQYNKRKPSLANMVQADPPLLNKETVYGLTGAKQHVDKENEFSQTWQTEVDVNGDESSCPSEMSSSFQKSASYSTKANEVESSERKRMRKLSKRESLASSSELSMGSPSYGSFTTYERIPIKHANGDDEIVTPVRRSSRIRNHQITSPP